AGSNVPQHWRLHGFERPTDGDLQLGALRLIDRAADDGAKVDGVRDCRTHGALVPGLTAEVEDVYRVAGTQRQLDINAPGEAGQSTVLMFRVYDEHLGTQTERAQRQRREQISLARA